MENIIEDDGTQIQSHKIISTEKLLKTHNKAIKELLKKISSSYNITINDAAFALSNTLNRFK